MCYQILTPATVVDYLKTVPQMQSLFSDFSRLKVAEIGDGNMNTVYRISDAHNGQSVVLKQALPYFKAAGEAMPMSRRRMDIEIMALEMAKKVAPDQAPGLYYSSTAQSLIIMEYLAEHRVLREALLEGEVYQAFGSHIGRYLAHTLFYSSDCYLGSEEKQATVKRFSESGLYHFVVELVFIDPYLSHRQQPDYPQLSAQMTDRVHHNQPLKIAIAQLRHKVLTSTQALLHGDLHLGSIMVSGDNTRVIDPEAAFYGPMGFDIGMLLGNLYMCYFIHGGEQTIGGEQAADYRRWLLQSIEQLWQQFADKFIVLWRNHESTGGSGQWQYEHGMADFNAYGQTFIADVLADSIGFAGCKMLRRVYGLNTLPYFSAIKDPQTRATIEDNIVTMASEMTLRRQHYQSISEVNALAQATAACG